MQLESLSLEYFLSIIEPFAKTISCKVLKLHFVGVYAMVLLFLERFACLICSYISSISLAQ